MIEGDEIEYRVLTRTEISKLAEMDRTETIDSIYRLREGKLILEKAYWRIGDWSPEEKQKRIAGLERGYDHGDTLFGAFDGPKLVGMSVLDDYTLQNAAGRFNFAGLWVSQRYRGRGVGRALAQLVIVNARELGASMLYVSATPSQNTVRFYMSMGFRPAKTADPNLFQAEPEDIHMQLIL